MPEITLDRRRVLVAALVLVFALAVGGRLLLHSDVRTRVPPPVRVAADARKTQVSRLYVDVVGAVRRPGLYRLPQGSRVASAVARAGGATAAAQLELVNLAAPLADGEQVVVPQRGAAAVAAGGAGAAGPTPAGPVHLNTATLEQLDALPGIGAVTAQKILNYRREHGAFGSVDELDAVPGIGPARLEQLRDLVAP